MNLKSFLVYIFLLLGIFAYSQNSLKVEDIAAGPGEKSKISIDLTNSDQVVGAEFTLTIPQGLILHEKESTLIESRKGDHAIYVNIEKNNPQNYHFIILSLTSTSFKESEGTLLEIPIEIPLNFATGQIYNLNLSGVVLSSKNATDIGSNHANGKLTIASALYPDLAVSGITTSESTISPRGKINVVWGVNNIGERSASGGWTEQVSIISEKTGIEYILGNVSYNEDLDKKKSISRNALFNLPKIIGIDGNVKIKINLIPNPSVKEPDALKDNNQLISVNTVLLEKVLYLTLDKKSIDENATEVIRATLSQSGDRTTNNTFQISASQSNQLDYPATVKIPKDQSSVVFYVKPIDNTIADGNRIVALSISGNNYPSVSEEIEIIDNDVSPITLTASKTTATDGDTINVTLQTDFAKSKDIKFSIATDNSSRWTVPQEVILPAGNKSISFTVEVKNNKTPEPTVIRKITARAEGFQAGSAEITLKSSNVPAFEFEIIPETISKSDGVYATYATIKRLDKSDLSVNIKLKANIANALILPEIIEFPANVNQKKFNIGAVNNAIADGTRKVNVTAEVYLTSCNCTLNAGISGNSLTKTITILDSNGPALLVKASPATIKAGQENSGKITITRNTTDTSTAILVKLSSDAPTIVAIPETTTIPIGAESVEVTLSTKIDPTKKGDQTVRVQAEADSFSSGFAWLLVTDQNKPDAVISKINTLTEASGKDNLEVTTTVTNQGFATFTKGAKIEYYLSKDKSTKNGILLATFQLDKDIESGKSLDFVKSVPLPEQAGDYFLIVSVNSDQQINELSYINNEAAVPIKLLSSYSATATVAKSWYKSGEIINITGSAKMIDNSPALNKDIEITITNGSFVRSYKVNTNNAGNFAYDFEPLQSESGHYMISAGYPGTKNAIQAEFDIIGFEWINKPFSYLKWDVVTETPFKGEFVLKNNSKTTLSNIKVELPANAGFSMQTAPLTLNAGQEAVLEYTLLADKPSEEQKYYEINFVITSNEGAKLNGLAYYHCTAQNAKLVANPVSINTTMTKGSSRYYEFTITNTGAVDAEKVKIEIPKLDWLKLRSAPIIEKIAPNETATITLELAPTEQQQLNVPLSGSLAVNLSNGAGITVPFKIETVSESTGSLTIDVVDEYTYNTEKAPHLKGAKVIVRHPFSGAVLAEGLTDENGLFKTGEIPEGYYTVTVTADKHSNYQNNILIDPGKTKKEEVFISYQAISYEWTVKPTEIEDKYESELIVKFETNVPKPVVLFEFDKSPIKLEPGQSTILNVTITNYGLINANNVKLFEPVSNGYSFKLLVKEIDVLAPKSSIIVPLIITRSATSTQKSLSFSGCGNAWLSGLWTYLCGSDWVDSNRAQLNIDYGDMDCIFTYINGFNEIPDLIEYIILNRGTGTGDKYPVPIITTQGRGGCRNLTNKMSSNKNNLENTTLLKSEDSNSVCATVTVKFTQTMTMTREAFEGTLILNNGGNTGNIKNVNLDLIIKDESGNDMTHLFQINKDAFLSGTGIVGPQNSQAGTVLFIPTKEAAPMVAKSYSFGGTLSYLDPNTNEKVTVQLYPVTLEVNPSPDLVLHYFMQRDIIGDDPLTEKVEPMVPAEMALLIKNEGYGLAKNVQVQSVQPEIIENKKGLLIDFEIIGSNFNNEPKQLGLLNVDFGTIEPQKAAIGQWWFTSTLLGHFVEYDLKVNHLSSFGNKNLSLIKASYVHELIKSVKAYGPGNDNIGDFLVNDIPDLNDTPDAIYYSNGESDDVYKVSSSNVSNPISPSQLTTTLTINSSKTGWNYGNLTDPGADKYKLEKVVRISDHLELPLENFWQTFVTLRDGADPKYENNLHFLDKISGLEKYTLYYTPINTNVPKVISFENVPATTTKALESIQVNFNKAINPSTFTADNIKLIHQGGPIALTDGLIGKVNDSTFVLNIKTLAVASGYYELTVQCKGIKDLDGNEGIEGKAVSWVQIIGELGIVQFKTDQTQAQSVNSVEIVFNKVVKPNQFTIDKLKLNGKPLDNVSIVTENNLKYTIVGLNQYNLEKGQYELTVDLPNIKAEDNTVGFIVQSQKWKVDLTLPEVDQFIPQFQGAVNNQNVTDMQIILNKPIQNNLDTSWIKLYKGSVNQNVKFTITKQDDLHYLISGLGSYTDVAGGYKLVIDQSNFTDTSGNFGNGTTSIMWTVKFDKPSDPVDMRIAPDRGISATDNITSGSDLSINLKTTGNKQTIALYAITPVSRVLVTKQYLETAGELNIPISGYIGKNTFEAIAYDEYGNEGSPVKIDAYIDALQFDSSINLMANSSSDCSETEYLQVLFTDEIVASEFTKDALIIKSSGINIFNEDLKINKISDLEFRIENLNKFKDNGDITFGIDLSKLHKKSSGLQGKGMISKNVGALNNVLANISGDLVITETTSTTTYTATTDMQSYEWNVTGGEIVSKINNTVTIKWTEKGTHYLSLTYVTPGLCTKTTLITIRVDATLAIEDKIIPNKYGLIIAPVPNNGSFTLSLNDVQGTFMLEIYDVAGKLVYKQDKVNVTDNFKKEIYTNLKNAGVYYLIFHNSETTYKSKFIIK